MNLLPVRGSYQQLEIEFRRANSINEWVAARSAEHGFEPRVKPKATTAEAGSPEKVEVLRMRVERGEELWHQDDPQYLDEVALRQMFKTGY